MPIDSHLPQADPFSLVPTSYRNKLLIVICTMATKPLKNCLIFLNVLTRCVIIVRTWIWIRDLGSGFCGRPNNYTDFGFGTLGAGRVADPDPERIGSGFNRVSGSGSGFTRVK